MISNAPAAWDVVIVPFPYTERLAEKRRPAVVISDDSLSAEGFVWIAMITSAGQTKRRGDVSVSDLSSAGLPGPSIVRPSKLTTVEPSRVLKVAGRLASRERRAVATAISAFLAKP